MRALSALAMVALVLTACARMPVTDDGLGFERRQAALGAIADWDIRGGIAVDDGERAYQARFTWQQRGDALELVVSSRVPGTRSFRIAGDETGLAVESRGETRTLNDPELQLSEMLGWWMPVNSAEHWLLGRPDPDYPAASSVGSNDTLASLDQRDWRIAYDEYQMAEGRLVPRIIRLTHAPLELTLRILDWESATGEP
jgi:outer membrane lipoprotein LolB